MPRGVYLRTDEEKDKHKEIARNQWRDPLIREGMILGIKNASI